MMSFFSRAKVKKRNNLKVKIKIINELNEIHEN